jgi:uncharacterized membrane protein YbhN (UPF0104 family)
VSLSTIFKVGVTLLIFGYVGYTVDLSTAWKHAANQNPYPVVLAGIVLLIQIGLGGVRWFIVLRGLGASPTLWGTLKLFYVSIFFNSCVLSGIGGDLVRAWLSYRGHVGVKTAVTSVILDRIAALAAVALLVLLTAPVLLPRVGVSIATIVPILLSLCGLGGLLIAAQLVRLPGSWLRFRPLRLLCELASSLRAVFMRPACALPLVGVAILAQAALAIATYTIAVSLDLNISFLECLALMQPVALIANLPISIGGWGVRETAMIALLGLVGVPASAALILSIQLGLLTLAVSLPGGLVWLALRSDAPGPLAAPAAEQIPSLDAPPLDEPARPISPKI